MMQANIPSARISSELPGHAPAHVIDVLRVARPKQWTKNVLVFVAPEAAGVLVHARHVLESLAAFAIFCAAASAAYFVNGTLDAERIGCTRPNATDLYVGVTAAYSLWLKRQAVIELTAVAAGFVLQAIAGGVATHVAPSSSFLVVIAFGALLLVIGKRASEYKTLGPDRGLHRQTRALYSSEFLRSALTLSAAGAVTT